jgi:hypothetical protein
MKVIVSFLTFLLTMSFVIASEGKNAGPDLARIKQYAAAELRIEKNRVSKKPDWNAIKAEFESMLPVVSYVDAMSKTKYSIELTEAIRLCEDGNRPQVNGQVLVKGLQHVTVLGIKGELDEISKPGADKKLIAEKIAAFFEGIRPTFARRDKGFFGGKKTLEAAAESTIERLKSETDTFAAARELEDVIARTYAFSMVYEFEELTKMRDSDPAGCEVKRTEASMFYRIIQPRIAKRSPKNDQIISNMLKGSYSAFDVQVLEKSINAGLGMKIK